MSARREPYRIDVDAVRRLWFQRQGLHEPRGTRRFTAKAFVAHLERTGGLQLDSVNVVDRAHHLTLWSRFGAFDRARIRRWTYRDRIAFEHWGHECCVLPASQLPVSRRAMRRFKPSGKWWTEHHPSAASIRRVLRRLREEGPLESADFESTPGEGGPWWGWKEDKRALEVLWHDGRVAVSSRTHFRRAYDIAERVYGEGPVASVREYEDHWLLSGLSGNGVASEKHLENYCTRPRLKAPERRKVITRALREKLIVPVEIDGVAGAFFAREQDLDDASRAPEPRGTTLVCPFDSLLWQRKRAEDLLDFHYRIEIYVPAPKRVYGYYVLPILHDGRFVGRVDPKLHRDRGELELKAIHLEPGFERGEAFDAALADTLRDLAGFLGAEDVALPRGWKRLLG